MLGALFVVISMGVTVNIQTKNLQNCPLRISGECVVLEIAETSEARAKGLSGRLSMADDEGMLLKFTYSDRHCIWMKDMLFSLDLLWLDEDGVIIDLKKEITPETYPTSFCSRSPARYVVEINTGGIASSGLEIGDKIELQ